MKKFRFKMEALLRVRKIAEERALGKLARVMLRVNEQESVRNTAFRLLEEEMSRFDTEHSQNFDLVMYQIYDRYLDRLNAEAADAARRLEEIRPELEREMALVMEARRQRRVVEILKERELAAYQADLRKFEKKQIEEANRLKDARARSERNALAIAGESYGTQSFTAGADAELEGETDELDELEGTREPEQPEPESDFVRDTLKQLGLDKPG